MLRFSYWLLRELRSSRATGIKVGVRLLALMVLAPAMTSAQRPSAMTSFRHAMIKEIQSLDWIGLYEQLAPYARWWKETADCARIPLPESRPDSVQFYYVNAVEFAPIPTDKPNRMVVGVTYASKEQIVLSVVHARNEIIVKHEMMHQILYWWGEPDWDDDARVEFKRCGLEIVR